MSDYASIQALMEKHEPPPIQRLPDAREIRLVVARQHIGSRRKLPSYVVKTMAKEYEEQGSIRKAAAIFGINHSSVARSFKFHGVAVKQRARQKIVHNGLNYYFDRRRYYVHQKRGAKTKHLHRVLWEERTGPIPDGMKVVFVTKNYSDMSDGNLRLMANAEYRRHILSFRKDRGRA